MKKLTIGEWVKTNEPTATIKNEPYWTLFRDDNGTHASVRMRVLVVKGGTAIAKADLGEVLRSADAPHDCRWEENSPEAVAANGMLATAEAMPTGKLRCTKFWGVNRAMPWEVVPPPRQSLWRRILAWVRGL